VAWQTTWSLPLQQSGHEEEHSFWQRWQDPQLLAWVEQALQANRDLQLALTRIRQARAQQRIVAANDQPAVEGTAAVLRDRASENDRFPLRGIANPVTVHQAGFDARWEWDLFGKNRAEQEAANEEWLAALHSHGALQVTLAAEVAVTYCDWRLALQQSALLQRQAGIARTLWQLVDSRVVAGLNPELDRHRAEDQALQIEARLPPAQAAAALALRRLAILIGAQADQLLGTPVPTQPLAVEVPALPEILPAQLLERRADLRAAEAKAKAAHARIAVAEGDKWPELRLGAMVGGLTVGSGGVLSSASRFYQVGPQLSWSLFRGQALQAAVALAEAQRDHEVIAWHKAAVLAMEEVEQALVRHQEHGISYCRIRCGRKHMHSSWRRCAMNAA
jgi:NodT family efflux transporter outer membrane factor (OMF) lipoprotein